MNTIVTWRERVGTRTTVRLRIPTGSDLEDIPV